MRERGRLSYKNCEMEMRLREREREKERGCLSVCVVGEEREREEILRKSEGNCEKEESIIKRWRERERETEQEGDCERDILRGDCQKKIGKD